MSASIGGTQWNAILPVGVAYVPAGNFITINGTDTAGSAPAAKTIGFGLFVAGPGTYTINDQSFAAFQVSVGAQSWGAGGGYGGSGTVTFTKLTSNSASGTFSFTGNPTGGGAIGTKAVTNGKFDVTF
jgi:hypothetical protein